MIDFYGNCLEIDWNKLIKHLEKQTPAYIGPSHKEGDPIPGLEEVTNMWNRAGYKTVAEGGTVAWDMFLPGVNFDQSIVDQFAKYANVENYNSAWVSRIHPGHFAPQHWDVNDDEEKLSKEPDRLRFHVHMSPPAFGHIFIVDDECLVNKEQGSTFKWSSRKLWHAGTNCGLVPKYIFNFW
jgi:hypothetical protein